MISARFDFSKFEKVEDIIYLDEPILSHLRFKEKDYFLYLVDTENSVDVFLLFEISDENLYNYLTKEISLRNLIINSNFINIIHQDFHGQILKTEVVYPELLPSDYLPNLNSLLEYNPTEASPYYSRIREFNQHNYLNNLRKSAFYLKFATESRKYGDTIGLRELSSKLLNNLSTSFKNFTEIEFLRAFGNKIPDDLKRNSIFNKILPDIDFRLVDFSFGSFEIGLSVDKIMKTNVEDKEVREWADNIGDLYKNIVLDDNIDEQELLFIIESYTEEQRNKIFKPIVNIVDDPNYSLNIRGSKHDKYRTLGIKNKKVSSKIITKNKVPELVSAQDLEIIQLTAVIDKNKRQRAINIEDSLFNVVENSAHHLHSDDFVKYGYENVPKDINIMLNIENRENHIFLSTNFENEFFEIEVTKNVNNIGLDEGLKKMIEKIYEFIITK